MFLTQSGEEAHIKPPSQALQPSPLWKVSGEQYVQ